MQPQPGRASVMIRSEPPVVLDHERGSMTWPLATVPASFVSGVTSILGAATGLAPAWRRPRVWPPWPPARSWACSATAATSGRERETREFFRADAFPSPSSFTVCRRVKRRCNRDISAKRRKQALSFAAIWIEQCRLKIHMVPIGGTAMVPLAALLSEEGHTITGTDLELYPPMSTLLEPSESPSPGVFAAEHVPAGLRGRHRRQRRPPGQRRGGRGGPARPSCPLVATGRSAVSSCRERPPSSSRARTARRRLRP